MEQKERRRERESVDVTYIDGMGVLRTKSQFIIILKDKFYGPFPNTKEYWLKVINVIEQK